MDAQDLDELRAIIEAEKTKFYMILNTVLTSSKQLNDGIFVLNETSDVVQLTSSFYYKPIDSLDIGLRASYLLSDTRVDNGDGTTSETFLRGLNDIYLSASLRLRTPDEYPGLSVFYDVALSEVTNLASDSHAHGKTHLVGATMFHVADPVVLYLTLAYRHSLPRISRNREIDPGETVFFSPSFSFVASQSISLSAGVSIEFQRRTEIDGQPTGVQETLMELNGGLNYNVHDKLTLRTNVEAGISGNDQGAFSMGLLYRF